MSNRNVKPEIPQRCRLDKMFYQGDVTYTYDVYTELIRSGNVLKNNFGMLSLKERYKSMCSGCGLFHSRQRLFIPLDMMGIYCMNCMKIYYGLPNGSTELSDAWALYVANCHKLGDPRILMPTQQILDEIYCAEAHIPLTKENDPYHLIDEIKSLK